MKKMLFYSIFWFMGVFGISMSIIPQNTVTLTLPNSQTLTVSRGDASYWIALKDMLEDADPDEAVQVPYLGPQASWQDMSDLFALVPMPLNAKQQWLSQVPVGRLMNLFYVANYLNNEDVLSAIGEMIADRAMLPGGAREILNQLQRFSSLNPQSRLLPLKVLAQRVMPQTAGLLASRISHRVQSAVKATSLAPFGDSDLAIGTNDGFIRILRGDSLHYLSDLIGHGGSVNVVAALPGGLGLISGSADQIMREWLQEAENWVSRTITGRIVLKSLTILPDGTVLSGDNQGRIKVWNKVAGDWHLTAGFDGHDRWVDKLVGVSDTSFFSGTLSEIKLWNKGERGWDSELIATGAQAGGQFSALAAWTDKKLVFGLSGGAIYLWQKDDNSVSSTELVFQNPANLPNPVKSLVCLPNNVIAAGFGDGTIGVFKKIGNVWQQITLTGHTSAVNNLVVMPDGTLVSSAFDGAMYSWVNPYDLIASEEDQLLLLIAYLSRQLQQPLTLLVYHRLGITALRREASEMLKNALSKAGWLRSPLHPERIWRWISTR